MGARASRLKQATLVGLIATGLSLTLGAGTAAAIDPPPPGPLDRPLADLAVLESATNGEGAPPLLLTADTNGQPPGSVRLALLDRDVDWNPVAEATASQPRAAASAAPWLIQVAPGTFVLIQVSGDIPRTDLTPVRVTPGQRPVIDVGVRRSLAMAVDDAGATDVDGDGTMELVLANARTERGGETCQGSTIRVLDGATMADRSEWRFPNVRLAGAALGAWDSRPGGDLVAYAYGNCPAGPDSAQRLGLQAIRLADGSTITTLPPRDPTPMFGPGVPITGDLDGDGQDEVVVRDGASLVILEPAKDWARTEIDTGDVMPVLAIPATEGEPGTLVWLEHYGRDDQLRYSVARVNRTVAGGLAVQPETIEMSELTPARRGRVFASMADQALAQARPQAWHGRIGGDCERILAPLLTTGCPEDGDDAMKMGASWLATQPVVAYDARNRRELLIAATVGWDGSMPRAATPAASGPPGAWRHGPSPSFVLSEVRAVDAAYFSVFPVPRPTIERRPVRTNATDLPGFTGARVFVRLFAMREQDPASPNAPDLATFFHQQPSDREKTGVWRIPVPAGAESGRDGSFVRVPLDEVESPDGLPPERWTLTIVQINDWGEVAGPLRGTIVLDSTGPSLSVETPFMSPVWPFATTIRGRSEPGIEIRGGNGGPVVADRRGRFEVTAALVPWPQTVELVATDELGNTTTARYSLIGGLDYRLLPWPAIAAVILLAVTFWSTGRGQRPNREVEVYLDDELQPEIEELTPARQMPRLRSWRP